MCILITFIKEDFSVKHEIHEPHEKKGTNESSQGHPVFTHLVNDFSLQDLCSFAYFAYFAVSISELWLTLMRFPRAPVVSPFQGLSNGSEPKPRATPWAVMFCCFQRHDEIGEFPLQTSVNLLLR